ncbi:hypothetical protein K491DRAFT_592960 [Lophiostoma macrostomum CBS 122681]|uniref:Transglycosylase SLT domain-containing protein n=1 Tax=Lophiostoma macrostomum CBS 122681 TaxID=1314788 RepID=A0A6A6THX8_9PLEO|nr:hypothetical protein K491DRAFT_592960 [Lophiostoma macrostomum CBS 122681]
MYSRLYTLFLIPFSAALPHVRPRTQFSTSLSVLKQDLQNKWTTSLGTDSPSNATQPTDPASFYQCSGPSVGSYPTRDQWLSFSDLWEINAPVITTSNSGDTYNDKIKTAIESVAGDTKVDARLILAIIMQESTGNVNIHCTGSGSTDCGLMQVRGGQSYSTDDSIADMVAEGVKGTSATPGYLAYFNADTSGDPFAAAHIYNVGSLSSIDLTEASWGGPNAYANDIASRLLGWTGDHPGCVKSQSCSGLKERTCY